MTDRPLWSKLIHQCSWCGRSQDPFLDTSCCPPGIPGAGFVLAQGAVRLWSPPARVSYAELLQAFWRIHKPTTRNRQGFDFGSQYRSAIFYHDAGQMEAAIASRDAEQQSLSRQIVTQITPASAFYRAEEYHQRYLEKNGQAACAATIR